MAPLGSPEGKRNGLHSLDSFSVEIGTLLGTNSHGPTWDRPTVGNPASQKIPSGFFFSSSVPLTAKSSSANLTMKW